MNILQVMGCTSEQYASMERYLVAKADTLAKRGGRLVVVYENAPKSSEFVEDLVAVSGVLEQARLCSTCDFGYYRQIRRLMRGHDVDVVHCYFTPTSHRLALALRLRGFRHVVRTAANMPYCGDAKNETAGPSLPARLRHRAMARLYRRIICRSEGVREAFGRLGVPGSRLAVADGGCDTDRYRFQIEAQTRLRGDLGIGDKDLVLGVCCRLVPVKRLDRLIQRVAAAAVEIPLRLLIAGDGPERARLESLVLALGLNGRVRFLGQRDDLADIYSAFDVFCLPSESEGMSNAILEAMACERPVLASDIPPNRGLVMPDETGYLLSFDDAEEFAKRLTALAAPTKRQAMGAAGRELVLARYSLDARIAKELAIYEDVLGRN